MGRFNYSRARRVVAKQIKRFGPPAGDTPLLIRDGITRECVAARVDFSPEQAELHEVGRTTFLVAANSVTVPPHHDYDTFYYAGAEYRIVEPIKRHSQQDADSATSYRLVCSYHQTVNYLRPVEFIGSISMGMGYDHGAVDVERIWEIPVSFGLGHDLAALPYATAFIGPVSFDLGYEMEPPPFAQVVHEISASFAVGYQQDTTPEYVAYMSASFAFGADMDAEVFSGTPDPELINVSFSFGYDMQPQPVAIHNIAVAFGLGYDQATNIGIEGQYLTAAFSLGYDHGTVTPQAVNLIAVEFQMGHAVAAIVTAAATNSGVGTATINDTTPTEGQTLTCTFNNDDPEGAATGITFQWRNQTDGVDISGATSATYIVQHALVGKTLRCRVNYTDGGGNAEQIETATTSAVAANPQVPSMSTKTSQNGSTEATVTTGTFDVSAGSILLIVVNAVGTGMNVGSITNNKGITGLVTSINQNFAWSQTVTKNALMHISTLRVPTAQTGMTISVSLGGTKQRQFVGVYEISGGHVSLHTATSIIRLTQQLQWNNASGLSWSLSTGSSETTSSRWVWNGMAVASGEAGENDNFNAATLGGVAASVFNDVSTAVPGMQLLIASRQAGATTGETMAISAISGNNAFFEMLGGAVEIRGTPP